MSSQRQTRRRYGVGGGGSEEQACRSQGESVSKTDAEGRIQCYSNLHDNEPARQAVDLDKLEITEDHSEGSLISEVKQKPAITG